MGCNKETPGLQMALTAVYVCVCPQLCLVFGWGSARLLNSSPQIKRTDFQSVMMLHSQSSSTTESGWCTLSWTLLAGREGCMLYGPKLIKCAECIGGADVPCCSKDTLQKQCWSSACWRAVLAATERKRKKSNYFITWLPWIWCVSVKW